VVLYGKIIICGEKNREEYYKRNPGKLSDHLEKLEQFSYDRVKLKKKKGINCKV